jgi:hypothetical protein
MANQIIFKHITENNHKKLESYLRDHGQSIDIVEMTESRLYTALAYSAFKNHPLCFKIIYSHGCKFNLPLGPNKKPTPKSLQTWAN